MTGEIAGYGALGVAVAGFIIGEIRSVFRRGKLEAQFATQELLDAKVQAVQQGFDRRLEAQANDMDRIERVMNQNQRDCLPRIAAEAMFAQKEGTSIQFQNMNQKLTSIETDIKSFHNKLDTVRDTIISALNNPERRQHS